MCKAKPRLSRISPTLQLGLHPPDLEGGVTVPMIDFDMKLNFSGMGVARIIADMAPVLAIIQMNSLSMNVKSDKVRPDSPV